MKWWHGVVVMFFWLDSPGGVFMASLAKMIDEPVAIVCFVSGKVFVTFDGKRTEPKLFQRLMSGTSVETEGGSKVVLAFFNGERYELENNASATLGPAALEAKKGAVQKLTSVPAMIDIAPIARREMPGTRFAATRIRTGKDIEKSISNLYPSNGAAAVAQTALVHFDPVVGYQKYKVEVEDETGNAVLSVETASTTVQIPFDVLRPGANYYLRVRTLDPEKPAARGEAVFVTLSEENARRRAALKSHVEKTKDTALLAVLAEVDHGLGLQREACEELGAALNQTPGNEAIRKALARFECAKPEASEKQRKGSPL